MIGTIRWNFILGAIGFMLTFLISFPHNLFLTTVVRSFYCFVLLFMVCFLFRWMLGTLVGMNSFTFERKADHMDDHKGSSINVTTPDEEDSLNDLLRQPIRSDDQDVPDFAPLSPRKLTSQLPEDPEELAKAVRHLTEE